MLIPVIALAVLWGHYEHDHRQSGYKAFVRAVFAVVVAMAIGFLIEGMTGRTRPFLAHGDIINELGSIPGNSSMPSMHTLTVIAFTVALSLQKPTRKLGFWLLPLALLVGLGRVMAGLHYPSDVIMGAVVGVFAAFLLVYEGSPIFRWLSRSRTIESEGNLEN